MRHQYKVFLAIIVLISTMTPVIAYAADKVEKKEFVEEVHKLNLPEQRVKFEKTFEIDEDGYKGEIPLDEVTYGIDTHATLDERMADIKEVVDHGIWPTEPIHENNINVIYYDIDKNMYIEVVVPYQYTRSTTEPSPVDWHTAQLSHYIAENNKYLIYGTNDSFNVDSDAPVFQGYEKNIVQMLGLSPDEYTVVGSAWVTDITAKAGGKERTAEYTLAELVTRFESVYSITIPLETIYKYTATATYRGTLEKTVFTPDPPEAPKEEPTFPIAATAAASGGTTIFIVAAFYYRRNAVAYAVAKDTGDRRLGSFKIRAKNPMNVVCDKYFGRLQEEEDLKIVLKKHIVRRTQGFTLKLTRDDYFQEHVIEGFEKKSFILYKNPLLAIDGEIEN